MSSFPIHWAWCMLIISAASRALTDQELAQRITNLKEKCEQERQHAELLVRGDSTEGTLIIQFNEKLMTPNRLLPPPLFSLHSMDLAPQASKLTVCKTFLRFENRKSTWANPDPSSSSIRRVCFLSRACRSKSWSCSFLLQRVSWQGMSKRSDGSLSNSRKVLWSEFRISMMIGSLLFWINAISAFPADYGNVCHPSRSDDGGCCSYQWVESMSMWSYCRSDFWL